VWWRLIDPYYNFQSDACIRAPHVTGVQTYALTNSVLVEGYIGDTGNGTYGFNVAPVSDGLQVLTLGNDVSGAITTPGQQQQYSFTLPGTARLYFDSLTNNGLLHWSLNGRRGNVVNNRGLNWSDGG